VTPARPRATAGAAAGPPLPIHLQRDLPVPLHEQISAAMRREIRSGAWPAHYRLPSEPDLAESFGVSRGTLRRALRTLIEEGLLVQVRGRGTFVVSAAIEQSIGQELLSLSEGLEREGVAFETRVVASTMDEAPEAIAGLLGLGAERSAFRLRRVMGIDGSPVAYLDNWVRLDLCPGLQDEDFEHESLFGLLEGRYGLRIAVGRRTFEAQAALGRAAEQLEIPVGAPVLYLEQVTYLDDGRPIEYSDVWIRGDRLKLTSVLRRPRPPA
jgi:DNA-binding GntR family transcriptional regulator